MTHQTKIEHEDGEVLKCTDCLAEDNACVGCGDYLYDGKQGECPSCLELMQALKEDYDGRNSR